MVTDRRKHGGKRKRPVSVLIPHHNAGVASAENIARYIKNTNRQLSATYIIGGGGEIYQGLDESLEPYTTGDRGIDTRGITFEVANSTGAPNWEVTDKAFDALVELSIDICKRHGIKEVNYTGDKKGNIHLHEWYQRTNCPGPYLKSKMPEYARRINEGLQGVKKPSTPTRGLKYKVGDKVKFDKLSTQSNGGKVITSYYKSGTIGKIYPNAQYPYRIGTNTGFLNDSMILDSNTPTTPKRPPKAAKTALEMAREVIAGLHGNGHENRRKSLGLSVEDYARVRLEVNNLVNKGSKPKKSIQEMAREVIAGKHGYGHATRQHSLGISNEEYQKVRQEVNKLV